MTPDPSQDPQADPHARAEADPWLAALARRRSVRQFRPGSIDPARLERLVLAAVLAPSPHNAQPWRFAIVTDPARKQRLADAMRVQWERDLEGDGLSPEEVERRIGRPYRRTLEAPAGIVVCRVGEGLDAYPDPVRQAAEAAMATQAIGAAVQNLLLTAAEDGLGANWICAPLFCGDVVRDALDLPADWEPQVLVLVGEPAVTPKLRVRRPVQDVITWR